MSTMTALRSRHLLGIAELEPGEIELILETAVAMKEDRHAADQESADDARPHRRSICSSRRARARACRSSSPKNG